MAFTPTSGANRAMRREPWPMTVHGPSHGPRAPIRRSPRKPPRARGSARKSCVAGLTGPGRGPLPHDAARARVVQRRIHPLAALRGSLDSTDRVTGRSVTGPARFARLHRPHDRPVCHWPGAARAFASTAAPPRRAPGRGPGHLQHFALYAAMPIKLCVTTKTAAMSGTRRASRTPRAWHLASDHTRRTPRRGA